MKGATIHWDFVLLCVWENCRLEVRTRKVSLKTFFKNCKEKLYHIHLATMFI